MARYFQHEIDVFRQELETNVTGNNDFEKLADERAHKNEEAEILYERIRKFEKENHSLKNEINNEQAVI